MTNYESIPYNDKDKFAEWLSKLDCIEDHPWRQWLDETYCKKCEPVVYHYKDSIYEIHLAPCERDKCPYGVDINALSDVNLIKLWFEVEIN